jgi:hypothetical protein
MISEKFVSRGLGMNWHPCFVCGEGGKNCCQNDMSFFVESREAGERIHALFTAAGLSGWLDYRPSEPSWVQYKLGVCPKHLHLLEQLETACQQNGNQITPEIIATVRQK